jgi:hypothetical protein
MRKHWAFSGVYLILVVAIACQGITLAENDESKAKDIGTVIGTGPGKVPIPKRPGPGVIIDSPGIRAANVIPRPIRISEIYEGKTPQGEVCTVQFDKNRGDKIPMLLFPSKEILCCSIGILG